MWLIIAAVVLAATFTGAFYMTVCVGRFGALQKVSGDRKWLRNLLSLIIIALIFTVISIAMTVVNAIIVFLNGVMFFIIFGLVMRIIKAVTGKETKINWQGWLAIVTMVIYHAAGYYLCFNVWQKDYALKTNKDVDLKVALFADSHIGTTFDGDGFAEQLARIEEQSPDIILIAGNLVDDSSKRADLEKACKALSQVKAKYGVWYCYGNHDKGYYSSRDFSAEELEDIMIENGIHVLSDEYELIDDSFYIVGRKDRSEQERKSMEEVLKGVDKSKYIIVMDHQPGDYDAEAECAVDLVVSGHTHGGQLFPITYVGEWFNINDATYGYERRKDTDFIVTSGISDWEIDFKTGTKSEYVMIDIEKE